MTVKIDKWAEKIGRRQYTIATGVIESENTRGISGDE